MNNYSSHKEYFERAYQSGTDIWSNSNYTKEFLEYARLLPHKGMVLDLGSGRGHVSFLLADLGMKVIGLDYVSELTQKNNQFVKEHGYTGKVAFKTGDIFDIPFQEESFDSVVDIGTLQHIHPTDWGKYSEEIFRVLKPGGKILLIELSRKTQNFLNFKPNQETTGNFEYEELLYHFFELKEIEEIFSFGFTVIKSEVVDFSEKDSKKYMFALLQKK